VIIRCDLPRLLVIATDHVRAFLRITLNREKPSGAILDAEEAITSIFESPLRIR
jgi:hypothetical protein